MYPRDDSELRLRLLKRELGELRQRMAMEIERSRNLRSLYLAARDDHERETRPSSQR